ncbi:PREDICTED: uncharacterized protein LOC109240029 [Nicotiana attenuata]|uniref:uncharacterized protein LOC109240029 n=1 Tax=Nicotiana attenuata TaxID=49451 RepID=UPI000904994A|nr:PREDICTED: uncharacterized protein LOC109240029 [Nicotiana attenuata]
MKVMPFGLKNAGATYMRAMTTIFHDMIHKEIKVYVDDVIIKSRKSSDHLVHLKKFFDRLRRYNLKLNPAKCAFGVPAGKLLGFIVSRRGIELDPSKIKAIQDLPPPKNRKDVMSFLGRLNYISRFIAQSTVICEPIFKMLRKDATTKWTEECQRAFDRIKEYLSNPPVLVPLEPGRPLLLYMMDPLKYIFQKPTPTGKLAKWQILLSEFDIVYVTQKAIKGQALADHLAENPVDEEYKPLRTYFLDEEVLFAKEDISEAYSGWRIFFYGAANFKGVGVGAVLVSKSRQHYPISAKLRFPCTNNMAEYEACILGLRMAADMNIQELLVIGDSDLLIHQVQGEWNTKNTKILPYLHFVKELCKKFINVDFKHVPRVQNEFADALATLSSMIQHPDKNYIDPIKVNVQDQPAYCFHVDEEPDGESWYYDINSRFVQKCHQCKIHGDLIRVPPNELNVMSSPWPFAAWGMDVIGPIEPAASNGHRFIMVAIDYFTKWVEASSYKSVTKKVIADFVRNNIVCRFGIPESIITDNGANLNSA